MVVRKRGQFHSIRLVGAESKVEGIISRGRDDGARTNADMFYGSRGDSLEGVVNPVDETFRILDGEIQLRIRGGPYITLEKDDTVFIPAREVYDVKVIRPTRAFCVLSQAQDGTLPD